MDSVVLVRHGETTWNRHGRIQGWAPSQLTDYGRQQAVQLGQVLDDEYDITAIHSSDLERARQTTDCLRQAVPAPTTFDPAWRERDFGAHQGLPYETLFSRFPEFSVIESGTEAIHRQVKGGESLATMQKRVLDAWQDLIAGLDGTCLVVTHGGPLYVVIGHVKELDLVASIRDLEQANCAINEVHVTDDGVSIVRENEVDW